MNVNENVPVDYAFGPMILLDPGSLAFDNPEKYGYSLLFKELEDYINGMSLPSWHQWISYETRHLDKEAITKLTIDTLEYSINLRERSGFYSKYEADTARFYFVEAVRESIQVVEDAMEIDDEGQRLKALNLYQEELDRKTSA